MSNIPDAWKAIKQKFVNRFKFLCLKDTVRSNGKNNGGNRLPLSCILGISGGLKSVKSSYLKYK